MRGNGLLLGFPVNRTKSATDCPGLSRNNMLHKIQVLVSGAGSTLDNLAQQCSTGCLSGVATISRVVADRECNARFIALKWGLPFVVIPRSEFESTSEWSLALFDCDVYLHVMGGFLGKVVVPEWLAGKVLNIHPAIDSKYAGKGMYGIRVHRMVVQAGEKRTGCTVHIVNNEYDAGKILAKGTVLLCESDTPEVVEAKVQEQERMLYPRVISEYLARG
jgi:phosphoribosylglycinamide formyltransferase 1